MNGSDNSRTESKMNSKQANFKDIQDIAGDIERMMHYTGCTAEQAGETIEGQMDGTQPADLIPQAVELAKQIRARAA